MLYTSAEAVAELRANDPHGLLSNADIEKEAERQEALRIVSGLSGVSNDLTDVLEWLIRQA